MLLAIDAGNTNRSDGQEKWERARAREPVFRRPRDN